MTEAPEIQPTRFPTLRRDLQEQPMGEDLMVYDPQTHQVHILNGTATTIYRLCDGKHDVDAMERIIRSSYHVTEVHDVRQDVVTTLALLREKKLLL